MASSLRTVCFFLSITLYACLWAEKASWTLVSLDGHRIPLQSKSLLLFAENQNDLKQSFAIATALAEDWETGDCYIVLGRPGGNSSEHDSLVRIARHYFSSKASKRHLALLDKPSRGSPREASPPKKSPKAALLNPEGRILWKSQMYPDSKMIDGLKHGEQ